MPQNSPTESPARYAWALHRPAARLGPVRRPVLVLLLLAACSPHAQLAAVDGGGETVLLPFPPDGSVVTWDSWAGPFVRDYCVQCHNPSAPCFASGCHTPGDPRTPDFEQKAAVVRDAPIIRCGIAITQPTGWDCGATASETFPVVEGNPLPTNEQRDLFVSWIDAGCP